MRSHLSEGDRIASEEREWLIPPPVAVMSSLDIELEMAFWDLEETFVVVTPMLVSKRQSGNKLGSLVWLAAKFDPRSDRASDEVLNAYEDRERISDPTIDDPELSWLERLENLRYGKRTWVPAYEIKYLGSYDD